MVGRLAKRLIEKQKYVKLLQISACTRIYFQLGYGMDNFSKGGR